MSKTSASYTILDYNDGLSIISKISANHPESLAYDPATGIYNPSWSTIPLSLTPSIFIAGRSGDILTSCKNKLWYYRRTGGSEWLAITNGSNGFTITNDILGYSSNNLFDSAHPNLEFKFAFTYHDPTLKIDFDYEVVKSFTRISNGTSVVIARAWSTDGEQFKNKSIPSSLTLQTELIRGVTTDTTKLTYQWQKFISGEWTNITSATGTTYKVLPSSVDGAAQFRCQISDTDSASDTYGETFTSDGVLILDLTDPYQAQIISTNGSFIKNGSGDTVLTCKVYQNGKQITSGISYQWYKNSAALTGKTSSTLTVTSDMIDVKADFVCEVL